MPVPIIDILSLSHSEIIEMFVLDLNAIGVNSVLRFCNYSNGVANVVWQTQTYTAVPIQATGFEYVGRGQIPTPQLTVGNVFSAITGLCQQYGDLVGAKLARKRTLVKYLDGQPTANPNWYFDDDVYFIDRKSNENKLTVTFELASSLDLEGVMLPRRIITANFCSWVFPPTAQYPECPYVGPLTTCDKTLNGPNGCKAHFGPYAQLPIGSYPGVDNNRV